MKLSFAILFFMFSTLISGCTSVPNDTKSQFSEMDKQIGIFESSCLAYYSDLIERKLGDDKSPEMRKKWEDIIYKQYRFSKDTNNPENERLKAIKLAFMICEAEKKLKI